ncbi:MAG: prenyltransferase, partial [Bacteroidales bacterium]|nr:prenyltransferase [Bacteroidales bacterium]
MASVKQWFRNARPTALPQSLMPAILALVLVINQHDFNLICGLLAVIGVACAHLAMNLADDYFDYKVDMHSDRDRIIRKGFRAMSVKYPYLLDGSATLGSLRKVIAILVIGAVLCGAPVFVYRLLSQGLMGADGCWWILAVVAATGVLG